METGEWQFCFEKCALGRDQQYFDRISKLLLFCSQRFRRKGKLLRKVSPGRFVQKLSGKKELWNVRESWVLTILTQIHNIGHIHNANFVQTQFSVSPSKITLFEKLRIYLFVEIFRLRVKIRNFSVPNKTPICHLPTL